MKDNKMDNHLFEIVRNSNDNNKIVGIVEYGLRYDDREILKNDVNRLNIYGYCGLTKDLEDKTLENKL